MCIFIGISKISCPFPFFTANSVLDEWYMKGKQREYEERQHPYGGTDKK